MGRKSSAKSHHQQSPGTVQRGSGSQAAAGGSGSGPSPLVLIGVLVVVVAIGVLAFWRPGSDTSPSPEAAANASAPGQAAASAVARAEANAKLGPRKQENLPPIPFQPGYTPARSAEVVTAAYQFAAEHPEILSYVPCFCGCERSGHQGNHDCFIKERAPNGDVVSWDPHGVDCAVCIDVATRSRQMHAAGASARDIRTAIDKEFGALYPTGRNMATPHPSHGSTH